MPVPPRCFTGRWQLRNDNRARAGRSAEGYETGVVLGAVIFLIFKELFWVFLLGWQQVALGALIVVIVVFFPQGLMGWMREQWPERFGHRVEETPSESAS